MQTQLLWVLKSLNLIKAFLSPPVVNSRNQLTQEAKFISSPKSN